jgi:hypothetical protein
VTSTFLSLIAVAALLQLGPRGPDYKKVNGEWALVGWSLGAGDTVHKLGADAKTFTVIQPGKYAKDSKRVYYGARPIVGADPSTFSVLKEWGYAKDKAHVFIMTIPIRGADPSTFVVIQPPYGRDAKRAYNGTVPMDVADLAHFEPLPCDPDCGWGTHYGSEGFLFDFGEAFANLEISQTNPVITGSGAGWARDGTYYYYGPARVEGADYASFRIINSFESADAHRKYTFSFPASELLERRKRYLHQ